MVRIEMKGKAKRPDRAEETEERVDQRRRPDKGPFRLQVDRQTKESYPTFEEAAAAGLAIKKAFPVVQVSVYDMVNSENKIIEVPV